MAMTPEERRQRDRERKRAKRAEERAAAGLAGSGAQARERPPSVSAARKRAASRFDAANLESVREAVTCLTRAMLRNEPDAAYQLEKLLKVAQVATQLHDQLDIDARLAAVENLDRTHRETP